MKLFSRITSLFILLNSLSLFALEVGDKAPDVTALTQLNQNFNFKEHYAKGYFLVFFYPRANTPGCTAQNKSLRDNFKLLSENGIQVVGVSTDSVEKQKEFHKDLNLPFPLISDEKEVVAKAFGVPVRLGFASRQAFLINNGKIVWVDHDASTSAQAEDVLNIIKTLKKKSSKSLIKKISRVIENYRHPRNQKNYLSFEFTSP